MKVEQTENYLKIENSNQEMIVNNDCITIRNKNKTLEDLRQKLINQMCKTDFYEANDVEILKILFEEK